jgi:hypothetical protein
MLLLLEGIQRERTMQLVTLWNGLSLQLIVKLILSGEGTHTFGRKIDREREREK